MGQRYPIRRLYNFMYGTRSDRWKNEYNRFLKYTITMEVFNR